MDQKLNRRDFHLLSAAALSGALAGGLAGCGSGEAVAPGEATTAAIFWPEDKHVCRGLNVCRNKGADGENACAGQGTCATLKHDCSGSNECKGQGGCGNNPGSNACKGQGGCGVPLAHAWDKARESFEKAMKSQGKTFGKEPPAPPAS